MTARQDDRSARQIARSKRRRDGDDSARVANTLMKLSAAAVNKLELDDDLRAEVDRARAVTSLIARRRAERALAGSVRRFDVADVANLLAKLDDNAHADVQQFHLAEQWRARLIDEGLAAAAEFPGGATDELSRLVLAAQRERTTGRPPGAARTLFRHVASILNDRKL